MTEALTECSFSIICCFLHLLQIEAVNVGPLQGIIIGHDNSGPGPGWFLDHVMYLNYITIMGLNMRNLSSGSPTRSYPNQPAQLHRLARILKFHL